VAGWSITSCSGGPNSWWWRLSGTRYHQPLAQDARRRIVAFFDRRLKS
jgi:hypothetical protein